MGLKHRKYIYVKRSDEYYVKVRVLNIRFGSKGSEVGDITDSSRYLITHFKTTSPPPTAVVVNEEALPEDVRKQLYAI